MRQASLAPSAGCTLPLSALNQQNEAKFKKGLLTDIFGNLNKEIIFQGSPCSTCKWMLKVSTEDEMADRDMIAKEITYWMSSL